jgi:hypothetical protein
MHLIAHELLAFLVVPVAHRIAGCAPLATSEVASKLWPVDNLCTISELCGS